MIATGIRCHCGKVLTVKSSDEGTHYYANEDGSEHVCKQADTPSLPENGDMPDKTSPDVTVRPEDESEDMNCGPGCFRRLVPEDADTSKRETAECRKCGATYYADLNGL